MNEHSPDEKTIRNIRWLIWLYFWLLIFEGALRKWVVPQLSNPLLIVRDPVLLLAYFLALRAGIFPANRWVYILGVIGLLSSGAEFCATLALFRGVQNCACLGLRFSREFPASPSHLSDSAGPPNGRCEALRMVDANPDGADGFAHGCTISRRTGCVLELTPRAAKAR